MTISDLIKSIKETKLLLFSILTVFILFSLSYSIFNVSFQKTEFNLYIQKKGTDETQDFKYDQYYTIQNIATLTKFITTSVKDPLFIKPIFAKLNEPYNKYKISASEKNLGVIGVKILSRHKEFLEKISEEMRIEINGLLNNLKGNADLVFYQVVNSSPSITRNPGNFLLNLIIFCIIGFICYLIFILARFAIKQEISNKN